VGTRRRILEASLELFNSGGVRRTTTNHIAAHLAISPGNLYYHFRNKEEIIREIFPAVTEAVHHTIVLPVGRQVTAHDTARYHLSGIEVLWDYRFFFRDLHEIVSRDPVLGETYRELQEWLVERFVALFERLIEQGDMRAIDPPEDIRRIAANAVIVWTAWVDFLLISGQAAIEPADVVEGALHGFLTFSPHLEEEFTDAVRSEVRQWGQRRRAQRRRKAARHRRA
jgi:AcrR family transcriptional regulator